MNYSDTIELVGNMGADLCGGVFPLSGMWVNMRGHYRTFAEVK